ncbi:MAG: beta-ketoacyl synthase N-terminal-like domain-containing protein, partial [Planctomycetaceae bacterium]
MHASDCVTRPSARVVVTGIGLATGLGPTRETTWAAIRSGRGAARRLDFPRDARPYLGCPSALADALRREDDPREPALVLLSRLAAEALADARLAGRPYDPARAAVLVGLSKGGMRSLGRLHRMVHDPEADPAAVAALWQAVAPSAGAGLVAREAGFEGPRLAPIAACATGLVAVLQGVDLIRRGACEVALAGSADAALEPLVLAAFRRMKVLAHDDEPARAVRPWDRNRSGFLVGEGGALLVLERADRAGRRGVIPYAEIAGGALGADAHHETDLNPDPAGLAHVIRRALAHSGVRPDEIDHVNVHGTATRANDPTECRA